MEKRKPYTLIESSSYEMCYCFIYYIMAITKYVNLVNFNALVAFLLFIFCCDDVDIKATPSVLTL